MADKKNEEFTVADRRRVSIEDGEVHDNPERAEESVKDEATAAPPTEESKKAEVREFPKREDVAADLPKEGAEGSQQPPVSAEDRKAGDAAFAASSKQIDDQSRSQL